MLHLGWRARHMFGIGDTLTILLRLMTVRTPEEAVEHLNDIKATTDVQKNADHGVHRP